MVVAEGVTPVVVSVNISEKKGVIKKPEKEVVVTENGLRGDAHAGKWHRQVSLLGVESIGKFEKIIGRKLNYGEFAENITTRGITLYEMNLLDRVKIGEVLLEITQIGKKCHGDRCAIYTQVGSCVMPKEGVFGRVLNTGKVYGGLSLEYIPKVYRTMIITLSDRVTRGEYSDRSGPEIKNLLNGFFDKNRWKGELDTRIIPDEPADLELLLKEAKEKDYDFVFTTGGTGIGPRDHTPDVVRKNLDKEIPGLTEMIRIKYGTEKPNALISRAIAGVMDKTLVYTMPGSVKAVKEYMSEILTTVKHSVYMLYELDQH